MNNKSETSEIVRAPDHVKLQIMGDQLFFYITYFVCHFNITNIDPWLLQLPTVAVTCPKSRMSSDGIVLCGWLCCNALSCTQSCSNRFLLSTRVLPDSCRNIACSLISNWAPVTLPVWAVLLLLAIWVLRLVVPSIWLHRSPCSDLLELNILDPSWLFWNLLKPPPLLADSYFVLSSFFDFCHFPTTQWAS